MTFPPPESPDTAVPAAPPAAGATGRYAHPLELGTMAIIVALDQVTKATIRMLLPLGESRRIIPQFLDLTHVHNTGAAFGLLNAADFPYKPAVMIAIAAIALVAIAAYATQLGFHERMARFGLALILGGAFGNLIDRAIAGYVVDFVDVYWGNTHFWAFNVADSAITIGAILVLLDMIGIGGDMHPILFEIGRFPVYTYGVLLAAAYLLGLQFALVRARKRGLDPNRVMDLGIWIIISALAGAKLLLLIVEFDTFGRNPQRAADASSVRRSVLRRSDCRGRRRAVVSATPSHADVDRHGCLRARHRARTCHRPHGLFLRRLLLSAVRPTFPGRSRSTTRTPPKTWERL